jgi:hypothetical protein
MRELDPRKSKQGAGERSIIRCCSALDEFRTPRRGEEEEAQQGRNSASVSKVCVRRWWIPAASWQRGVAPLGQASTKLLHHHRLLVQ